MKIRKMDSSDNRTLNPTRLITGILLLLITEIPYHQSEGFNLWVQGSRKMSGPKDSQFGFSVALWSDDKSSKRLVVGAPRSREVNPPGFSELRLGNIFLCDLESQCRPDERVPTVNRRDGSEQALSAGPTMEMYGMGFGMALSSLKQDRSPLAACAPRYPRDQNTWMENRGACFIVSDTEGTPVVTVPYLLESPKAKTIQNSMMGFSTTFINETEPTLAMGGPGAFYGEGVVVNKPVFGRGRGHANRIQNRDPPRKEDGYTHEGWQIVQGLFDGENTSLAVSVVNYGSYTGKVKLYPKNMEIYERDTNNYLKEFFGTDVGAKFGYSLGVGDFDGDRVEDLVVGSPWSPTGPSDSSIPDAGKIFLYYAPLKQRRDPEEIYGTDSFGRFGLSVSGLGDLNRDGIDDLAVAAPYAGPDGNGVVYIYNGSPYGLLIKATQVLRASDFPVGLRGFGFSLDGGIDMDGNGFPDVLIGAVDSDEAVFVRSAPVVTLEGSVSFQRDNLKVDDKDCFLESAGYKRVKGVCFDLILDVRYKSLNKLSNITMEFRMVLRDQADPPQFVFKVNNDHRYSQNVSVLSVEENSKRTWVSIFAKSNRSVIGRPVKVTISAHLISPARPQTGRPPSAGGAAGSPRQNLGPVPPVLDILSPTTFNASVILTCDNNKTCFSKPDMSLSADPTTLIIGGGPVNISVTLDVRDDPAYDVEVTVNHPSPLKYLRVEGDGLIPECFYRRLVGISEYTKFSCRFTFIEADEKVQFYLFFEHKPLDLLDYMDSVRGSQIPIDLKVHSDCVDTNERDNAITVPMGVMTRAIAYTKGESIPETMTVKVNETLSHEELEAILRDSIDQLTLDRLGPRIRHEFSFTNRGPSPIKGAKLQFQLALYQDDDMVLYLLDEPTTSGGISCKWPKLNPWNLQKTRTNDTQDLQLTSSSDETIGSRKRREATRKGLMEAAETRTQIPERYPSKVESSNIRHPIRSNLSQENSPRDESSKEPPEVENISISEDFSRVEAYALRDGSVSRRSVYPAMDDETKILECKDHRCKVICDLDVLDVEASVFVSITGFLIIASLDKHGYRRVGVRSEVSAEVSQKDSTVVNPSSAATTFVTLLRPPESGLSAVPFWLLLLAVLGSVLLILIIIVVLWKAGFFKRKRPPIDPKRKSLMQADYPPPQMDEVDIADT